MRKLHTLHETLLQCRKTGNRNNRNTWITTVETIKTNYRNASLKQFDNEPNEGDIQKITPRFVLIHTLAHLLINQFVNYCGYNAASLRERIYASNNKNNDMAGFLIYTADGDADNSLLYKHFSLVTLGHCLRRTLLL